jgi:hypothetical protein
LDERAKNRNTSASKFAHCTAKNKSTSTLEEKTLSESLRRWSESVYLAVRM